MDNKNEYIIYLIDILQSIYTYFNGESFISSAFFFISYILFYIFFFLGFLLAIAYVVLLERKLLGSIQRRKGPNKVGFFGLLQPLADGIKLLCKEYIFPKKSNRYIFIIVSLLTFFISFVLLSLLHFSFWFTFLHSNYSIFIMLGILSLNTLFIPLAGWSSHSRYAFLGGIRDIAQIISYELSLAAIILIIFFTTGHISIYNIIESQIHVWNVIYLFPVFLLFVIVFLAKLNRVPFDLPEGEAELVAGFNVEYSSFIFALFFLGEYGNIFFISVFSSILFFGGWLPFSDESNIRFGMFCFISKILMHVFFIIWIRGTLPRYRYDQLIKLGWKFILPLVFFFLIFYLMIDISLLAILFFIIISIVVNITLFELELCIFFGIVIVKNLYCKYQIAIPSIIYNYHLLIYICKNSYHTFIFKFCYCYSYIRSVFESLIIMCTLYSNIIITYIKHYITLIRSYINIIKYYLGIVKKYIKRFIKWYQITSAEIIRVIKRIVHFIVYNTTIIVLYLYHYYRIARIYFIPIEVFILKYYCSVLRILIFICMVGPFLILCLIILIPCLLVLILFIYLAVFILYYVIIIVFFLFILLVVNYWYDQYRIYKMYKKFRDERKETERKMFEKIVKKSKKK